MTLLLAMLLAQQFPTSMSVRNPILADGGTRALVVDCPTCPGGGGAAATAVTSDIRDGGILQQQLADMTGKMPALVSGRTPVDPSGVTSPVSAAALPLPTGASTSSLQTTGNTSLSSIDGKLPPLTGGKIPVDIGASIVSVTGGLTDTQLRATPVPVSASALPLPAGAATETTVGTLLTSGTFTARLGTLGQKAMAGSAPVVIASDQTAVPMSAVALPLPTGASTDATLSQLFDGGVVALGRAPNGQLVPTLVDQMGSAIVLARPIAPLNPFFPRCNAVRKTGCQP